MRHIIALFALLFASSAFGLPLDNWPTWNTNFPFIAKQVPPNAMIMRGIGTDEYFVLEVDPTTGAIPVDLEGGSISIDYSGPTGDPVSADAAFIGGEDPSGDLIGVAVDAGGRLQIDAVTDNDFVGTTGAAVPAEAGYMAGIDGSGDLRGIKTDTGGELQVDVLSSALPTGAATDAGLVTIDNDIVTMSNKIPALGQSTMAGSLPVTMASDQDPIDVNIVSPSVTSYAASATYDYSSGSVTTGAWTQLTASTAADIELACITDQSGQIMELGSGSAASETRIFLIARGFSGCIPLNIPAGTRLSLRAVSATASSGDFVISGMN